MVVFYVQLNKVFEERRRNKYEFKSIFMDQNIGDFYGALTNLSVPVLVSQNL